MAKLPKQRQMGKPFSVRANDVAPGTQWLLRVGGYDWATGTAEGTSIRRQVDMGDFGSSQRKLKVELVLANEACENTPWKLTRKIGYLPPKASAPAAPAPRAEKRAQPRPQSQPTPPAVTPRVRTPKGLGSLKLPKTPAVSTTKPKIAPLLKAPSNGRTWLTPTEVTSHSNEEFKDPKLPRTALEADSALSTPALGALGGLFLLIAAVTAITLFVLNKKDAAADASIEEGRLPSHLDTSDIGSFGLSEAGVAVVQQGGVPSSLLAEEAAAPVLDERADAALEQIDESVPEEEPTEVVGHVPPDHIASAPGDVPVPVAGTPVSTGPMPPPIENLGEDATRPFLEEPQPEASEVPPLAEPQPGTATAGALAAAAAAAEESTDDGAAPSEPEHEASRAEGAGNGRHEAAPTDHLNEVIGAMLEDGSVQNELRSIVAEARDDALRQGMPVDRSSIISELERVTSSAPLSPPAREQLMSRFEQIVSEELERVPQPH
jgi:hypothetical protein